ncbi:hypothetical protein SDC9_125243 [bioreactor metagenome]|uniref:Uncharacterized protein n=1 Tax=bioreactor metagenome TaxID=1076179 RepID=A0A645CN87_9ZZZZ
MILKNRYLLIVMNRFWLISFGVERIQRSNQLRNRLPAILLRNCKTAQQCRLLRGRNRHAQCGGRFQLVVTETLDGFRRGDAGDRAIDGCAKRIDVRPGTLLPARKILFLRRIAGLEHHGKTAVAAVEIVPRRAEIDEFHVVLRRDHDVIRADVAMDETGGVHLRK